MARWLSVALWVSACGLAGVGCAAQEGAAVTPAAKAKPAGSAQAGAGEPAEAQAAVTAAPGHLSRPEVEKVLRQGPPWLLRRVVPEEVIRNGRFVGWRILSMPADWGVDLKNGDVVTKVNGLAIERPDDLWAAWMQMQSAAELRISYERDGAAREVVMPIDGASMAGGSLQEQQSVEPPPKARSRWKTVVIEGDDAPPLDPAQ
ncbi:MAG: serine protease [Polyangiaceae bacterium]